MNKILVIFSVVLLSSSCGISDEIEKKPFSPPGKIGLGLILGSPTGISGKYWLVKRGSSRETAVSGVLSWSLADRDNKSRLQICLDWLMHTKDASVIDSGKVPLFYGFGLSFLGSDKSETGIRIPLGAEYFFNSAPFEIFFEIVPGLKVIPATEFQLQGGIGARYYF